MHYNVANEEVSDESDTLSQHGQHDTKSNKLWLQAIKQK